MASTYLSKSVGSINEKTFTVSFWVKRGKLADEQHIFGNFVDGNNRTHLFFRNEDTFQVFQNIGGTAHSCITNAKFRDVNGWYHIVVAIDTTQATASNRCRIYVNGVEQSLDGPTYHNQNTNLSIRGTHYIGRYYGTNDHWFSGSLSHLHFIDGTNYDATAFGETDSTTGEWKIKTSPSVTYGTEGYFILKDGNSVTNQAGNSAGNFSVSGGTLTKTEDCPSNVFATVNPLNVPTSNAPTFANGNTTSTSSTTNGPYKWGGCTTLGMTSGKFYCEAKATVDNTYSRNVIGITGDSANIARANVSILNGTHSWGYYSENGTVSGNGSGDLSGWNTAYTTGDIIMMALDLSNNKLYFGKNGTWLNSGVPTSGSTGTGAVSIIAANTTNDGVYFFAQTDDTGTQSPSKFEFNFGNGYFGTTAVSSAGTNASNIGIFEYDVPAGYTALSTKGLNL